MTLRAQILDARQHLTEPADGWRCCLFPLCAVVYFQGDHVVLRGETRAIPAAKGTTADRTVCFCFGHTAAQILADVASRRPSIQASIEAACRAGQGDCARRNPLGRCCLGEVGLLARGAVPASSGSCCGGGGHTTGS